MSSSIIEEMKMLGLTEYEVKAYLALLEEYPLNGYGLSKKSSVPRSRIYEVLDSLKSKGYVFENQSGKTSTYSPIDPKIVITRAKKNFSNTIQSVDSYTEKIFNKLEEDNQLKIIIGKKEIIQLVKSLIENSKSRIAVSIWDEELMEIKEELKDAEKRGVSIKGMYFGHDNDFKDVVCHRRIDRYLFEKNQRYMIIVFDNESVVSGVMSRGEKSQVTWTMDKEYVEISDDYIAHDHMLNKYIEGLKGQEKKNVDDYLDKIREEYYK